MDFSVEFPCKPCGGAGIGGGIVSVFVEIVFTLENEKHFKAVGVGEFDPLACIFGYTVLAAREFGIPPCDFAAYPPDAEAGDHGDVFFRIPGLHPGCLVAKVGMHPDFVVEKW